MGDFLFAARSCLGFLTTIPVGISMEGLAALGKRLYLFPVIGAVIGLLIGGIGYLFGLLLPPEAASVMIVASLYYLTGINHLDGLSDFGDGFVAHGSREKKIGAMRDVSLGIGGVVFCVIAVLGLFAAMSGILGRDPAGVGVGYQFLAVMIAAEVSAKQAMLTISAFGKSIHLGLGSIMIDETGFREFAIGLIFSAAVCVLVFAVVGGGIYVGTGAGAGLPVLGVAMLSSAIALSLVVLRIANRNFGGISGDVIGATNEIARLGALLVAVAWMV
uniref:Adenosylcobinamide-GDP ribazoletransferase n=1 Tax=Candidatus Methanogaster sp. ANME-2c ERB4 TaxID=2759911 RepID=A0A7G9YMY3_9EURY|nr:adenosylcobinamide-GDP ribazoletransferase [Methanosarcinales archaeon ANME-2c ERB4]